MVYSKIENKLSWALIFVFLGFALWVYVSDFCWPSKLWGQDWILKNELFKTHYIDISGTTYYFMYTTSGGDWYMKAMDTTNTNQFRTTYYFVVGDADYATAWTNRASYGFKVFEEAF